MLKILSLEIKKIKSWVKKNNVFDVIVFGSVAKGKENPRDIDLCILIKDEDEKKGLDLVDSIGKVTDSFKGKYHINILSIDEFLSGNMLGKTLLSEGFSIKNNKMFSSVLNFESKVIFIYSLKSFSSSKRVQFHYLLRGRYGSKGILKEVEGKLLSPGIILVGADKEDMLREIFDRWNINYKIERILFG